MTFNVFPMKPVQTGKSLWKGFTLYSLQVWTWFHSLTRFNEWLLLFFFPHRNRVLRMSDDQSLGKVHWDLALCLLFAWVICYFCIWKGIKTTGKARLVHSQQPQRFSPFASFFFSLHVTWKPSPLKNQFVLIRLRLWNT